MINIITFTGADDSVRAGALLDISANNPFVEWGILYSRKRQGEPRYPTNYWLDTFYKSLEYSNHKVSLHICGELCKDIVSGKKDAWKSIPFLVERCQRVQLNFKSEIKQVIFIDEFLENLRNIPVQEIILPYDIFNVDLAKKAKDNGINVSLLFDNSRGMGILPANWPKPIPNFYCGYAGGLGPSNLFTQIEKIKLSSENHSSWIDMENSLRSNGIPMLQIEDYFNLDKVLDCIQIVSPHIGK